MAENDCALGRLDPIALAWAAGFYDGEGSTFVYQPRPGYLRLDVSVSQAGEGIPEVLHRFQAAMLGMGEIEPPIEDGTWKWRSRSFGEAQAAVALLWRWLGPVKRGQAAGALRLFLSQYGAGRLKARPPRRRPSPHRQHDEGTSESPSSGVLDLAWAAGFIDGEGCFGLVRENGARKPDRPAWYRIRASACQHGVPGGIPHVLVRLREILGLGRFEPHGEPDAYKWVAAGPERVEHVLAQVGPWLGSVKVDQAHAALAAFRAQVRLKGNTTHCLRGHAYTREIPRASRASRKICNACSRIRDRMKRAAQGIKPRQFRNVARRYTF